MSNGESLAEGQRAEFVSLVRVLLLSLDFQWLITFVQEMSLSFGKIAC